MPEPAATGPEPAGRVPAGPQRAGPRGAGPAAGLLLAAGAGRRYGMPKALVERDGRLLVEHALDTLRGGGCEPLVVVLGAAREDVRARARLPGALLVENPDWDEGMGSSLRAGLDALGGTPAVATVVLLVDTPGVSAAAVRRIAGYAAPDALVVATYRGERGHPVLLGRRHWAGVRELARGDLGARPYLAGHDPRLVACEDVADGGDLDEPPATGP